MNIDDARLNTQTHKSTKDMHKHKDMHARTLSSASTDISTAMSRTDMTGLLGCGVGLLVTAPWLTTPMRSSLRGMYKRVMPSFRKVGRGARSHKAGDFVVFATTRRRPFPKCGAFLPGLLCCENARIGNTQTRKTQSIL